MVVKSSLTKTPSKMSYVRSSAQNLKIARQAQMSDFWIIQKLGGKRRELSSDMRAASAFSHNIKDHQPMALGMGC